MYLIVVLIALGFLQVWGEKNPFHRDQIFEQWLKLCRDRLGKRNSELLLLAVCVALPVAFVGLLTYVFNGMFLWVMATVILLFSLGRGEFAPDIEAYTQSCGDNDWDKAIEYAKKQGVDTASIDRDDWLALNEAMLSEAAYQGFERLFCVLFWFATFGPVGALVYRLSFLFNHYSPSRISERWLWAIEWPAVRVLGVSFAVTGNFVGCINRWKVYILCQTAKSHYILKESVMGALSVDDELVQSCNCTQREVSALKRLYTRTLWLWVLILALWTIIY